MLASLLIATTLWPTAVTQQCNPAENINIVGVAQSAEGKYLYCEQIEATSEHSLFIRYLRDGKQFAEKKITYTSNPATPSIEQLDSRSGEMRLANISQQTVELQYKPGSRDKNQRTSIAVGDVDVVDAGFDYFIRQHWDELQAGKVLPVNFASIAHLKLLPLRVRKLDSEKCTEDAKPLDDGFCYFVEIDNVLLRLVLGNIKLTYDSQRRLTNFNGVVNIEDDKSSTQSASIHYYYQSDYLQK